MKKIYRKNLLVIGLLLGSAISYAQNFYFGADLSYVNEMEDCGANYKAGGVAIDPYQIFSDHGTNLVRLRLWHTPSWYDNLNDGMRYSDFDDVRISIMRAKAEGMDVLLDFHLSDNWADPGHQVIPAAWASVVNNLPVLEDSLYNYIFSTLDKLAKENLLPELVQIGNETNRGILLSQQVNDAGWTLDWDRNSTLFNSAIAAVRDIETAYTATIKIAIHIADPPSVGWYIEQFVEHGVEDFDIIGISYYWQWHMETIGEVGNIISTLKNTYPQKEVLIFETAYPWTTVNADGANNILSVSYPGYSPFSPSNQKNWMIDLTQEVINNGGKGVIYWEPAWVSTGCSSQWAQGSSWDNATFFNSEHELIENGGIAWMTHEYDFLSAINEGNIQENKLNIYQNGNDVYVDFTNNLFNTGSLKIGIYGIDGKSVYNISVLKLWAGNIYHFSIPGDLVPGCYVIILLTNEHLGDGRLLFIE